MTEFHLRRRIPPKPAGEIAQELMDANSGLSHYDAQVMAGDLYASNMQEIYRLARIGEKCLIEHAQDLD